MFFLFLCSLISLSVILYKSFDLKRARIIPHIVESSLERLESYRDVSEIEPVLRQEPSPLSRLGLVSIGAFALPKSDNIEAVQSRAKEEIVEMESGLTILEIVSTVAPLLGLLGTASGLVRVFANIGSADVEEVQGIALGIAEVLNTTIVGLAIAIPSLIAYSYFTRKVEAFSVRMEALLGHFVQRCYLPDQESHSRH